MTRILRAIRACCGRWACGGGGYETSAPGRADFFLALAIVGLLGTWTSNILSITHHRDFIGFELRFS